MSPREPLALQRLEPWIEEHFDPASGPGGQRLNRASTRVALLFDFERCPILSDGERARIRERLHSRLARDGRLRVVAGQHRDQARNRSAARERLLALVDKARRADPVRRPTRPTRASRERRLADKRRQAERKRGRRPPDA